jgi:hypothetical protein
MHNGAELVVGILDAMQVLKELCSYVVHTWLVYMTILGFNLDEIVVNSNGHRFNE